MNWPVTCRRSLVVMFNSACRFSAVSNPLNLADEYAYASTDQRHRFIGNVLVDLSCDLHASASSAQRRT